MFLTDQKHTEEIAARRWILVNIPVRDEGEPLEDWFSSVQEVVFASEKDEHGSTEGQRNIKRVLNTYEFLGFVARNYWELDDEVLDWISPMVAKTWVRLADYVAYESQMRNEPDYYEAARELGEACIDYRKARGLGESRLMEKAL